VKPHNGSLAQTRGPFAEMTENLTEMLRRLGDSVDAVEKVLPLVYGELRAIAAVQLRQERPGHTLLTTDLVHEAYLRLFRGQNHDWNDRKHFFSAAALAMRRILVDHARRKTASKRIDPDEGVPVAERPELGPRLSLSEMLDLDQALDDLQRLDPRQCEIVHLQVFAGLTGKETAELMGLSQRTVAREWFSAKAWLREQIVG
jgi:RNA polymerase sigma factor (TIGR02999 family)